MSVSEVDPNWVREIQGGNKTYGSECSQMNKKTIETIAWMALALLVIGVVAIALTTTLEHSTMTRSDMIDYWTYKEVVTQFTNPNIMIAFVVMTALGGAVGVLSLVYAGLAYSFGENSAAKGLMVTAAAAITLFVISIIFLQGKISTRYSKYIMTATGPRWEGYFTNVRLNLNGLDALKKVAITFIAVGGAAFTGALGARFHASKKRESQLNQQKMAHNLLEDAFTVPAKVPSD